MVWKLCWYFDLVSEKQKFIVENIYCITFWHKQGLQVCFQNVPVWSLSDTWFYIKKIKLHLKEELK